MGRERESLPNIGQPPSAIHDIIGAQIQARGSELGSVGTAFAVRVVRRMVRSGGSVDFMFLSKVNMIQLV